MTSENSTPSPETGHLDPIAARSRPPGDVRLGLGDLDPLRGRDRNPEDRAGIAERAAAGDTAAAQVFAAAGTALARAIVVTAGVVDVTTVVIGGGVSGAWDLLQPALAEGIANEPPVSGHPIRVTRARLGSDAVAIGAAARAVAELPQRASATAPSATMPPSALPLQ